MRAPEVAICGYSASAPMMASVLGLGSMVIATSRNPRQEIDAGIIAGGDDVEIAVVMEFAVHGETIEAEEHHAVLHDDRHRGRDHVGGIAREHDIDLVDIESFDRARARRRDCSDRHRSRA